MRWWLPPVFEPHAATAAAPRRLAVRRDYSWSEVAQSHTVLREAEAIDVEAIVENAGEVLSVIALDESVVIASFG